MIINDLDGVAGCHIFVTKNSQSVICRDYFKRGHLLGLNRKNESVTTTLRYNYNYSELIFQIFELIIFAFNFECEREEDPVIAISDKVIMMLKEYYKMCNPKI